MLATRLTERVGCAVPIQQACARLPQRNWRRRGVSDTGTLTHMLVK